MKRWSIDEGKSIVQDPCHYISQQDKIVEPEDAGLGDLSVNLSLQRFYPIDHVGEISMLKVARFFRDFLQGFYLRARYNGLVSAFIFAHVSLLNLYIRQRNKHGRRPSRVPLLWMAWPLLFRHGLGEVVAPRSLLSGVWGSGTPAYALALSRPRRRYSWEAFGVR